MYVYFSLMYQQQQQQQQRTTLIIYCKVSGKVITYPVVHYIYFHIK